MREKDKNNFHFQELSDAYNVSVLQETTALSTYTVMFQLGLNSVLVYLDFYLFIQEGRKIT